MTIETAPSSDRAVSALAHWADKARAWTDNADIMARTADAFNNVLLEAALLKPGQQVLDLASGAGEPALTEAKIVGPDGIVVATDLVVQMLHGLQNRDKKSHLYLCACDMQALPFAPARFDRVVCRFGIMFPPDPLKALEEARRVLKPDGRAAYMVWGPLADQRMFSILFDAVEAVLGTPPNPQHHNIFRFGPPDSLAASLRRVGFRYVTVSSHVFQPLAPLNRPFWRPQLGMTFGSQTEDMSDAQRAELDAAILDRLQPYRETAQTGDDGYRLHARVHVVSATA